MTGYPVNNDSPHAPLVAYEYYPGHVYLNISNRCTNACVFCSVRRNHGWLGEFKLNLGGTETAPCRIHPAALETVFTDSPSSGSMEDRNTGGDENSASDHPSATRSPGTGGTCDSLCRILSAEPEIEMIKTCLEPYCAGWGEGPIQEFVFCGAGEPLVRLDAVLAVSAWLKEQDFRVRINTNGHARLMHGPSVAQELSQVTDAISISLNANGKNLYNKICRPSAPEEAFESLLEFSEECGQLIPDVTLSVVSFGPAGTSRTHPLLDLDACADLASSLGARFRIR